MDDRPEHYKARAFSWDTAIDRTRQLAGASTPASELLTFYATVLAAQKEIYGSLRGLRDWLPSGELADDLSVLHEYVPSFLQTVKSVSPPALAEQATQFSAETLLHYWHERSERQFFAKAFLHPYARFIA